MSGRRRVRQGKKQKENRKRTAFQARGSICKGLGSATNVASLVATMVKNLPAMWDPWRREWQPIPVFLPGEFHEQRSLAG